MALEPGAPFPPLMLPRVGGGSLRVPAGPALVFFFRAEEGDCSAAAEAVERIAEALVRKGLTVIGISQDDAGDAASFATDHGLGAIDLCVDAPSRAATHTAGIDGVPACFLIDGNTVLVRVDGFSRPEYGALAARAAMLVGAPAPSATRPGDDPTR